MTRAKHLHGASKTEAVRGSFEKKLEHMKRVLDGWIKSGELDDRFWPQTLVKFREWESPDDGIYKWKSPSVTKSEGRYQDLVARYWELQGLAKKFNSKASRSAEVMRLKDTVRALAEQNALLTWQIVELRDALVRIDGKNAVIQRITFP